jgi:hypothetical protein
MGEVVASFAPESRLRVDWWIGNTYLVHKGKSHPGSAQGSN